MKKIIDYNILLVDDEEDIRFILKVHFELAGYKVHQASSGREALEILSKQDIDFIISDVCMPDGSGEELLEALKSSGNESPQILMLSGHSNMSKERAIELGALDMLPKPVKIEILESYINKARNS